MGWHTVDFVVRRHHTHDASFSHRGFETGQEHLAQRSFGKIYRSNVGTAFRLAVSSEMFGSGDDMILVDTGSRTLQCFDNGHRHARSQIRILAVGLFSAAPTWFACEIQVWSKHLLTSARTRFHCSGGENLRDKLRIPGGGECYWLRKTRAALGHVAVKYFVMKNRRNAESRVLDQPFLHSVGKHGALTRTFSFSLSRNLPDAVLHDFGGLRRIEVAAVG